jgi:transcriptional regulator with XRE-family HTH domain
MVGRAAAILREARHSASLTQTELAARSGVSRSALSLYESSVREPGADVFLRLLEAADAQVSIARFTTEELRRGRIFSDVLAFAAELPHRWPGDRLEFPAGVWRR